MSLGKCGYPNTAAIGAKVGRPHRPAKAYVCDGAWGLSLAEVMTCVRESIPAIAVVFNNGQWGAEKKNQVDYFENRYLGTNLKNPNFAEVAEAMGANGITVEHVDEVGDALRGAVRSSRPTVINMMLTQELGDTFRRDAFRLPRRLLAVQKYSAKRIADPPGLFRGLEFRDRNRTRAGPATDMAAALRELREQHGEHVAADQPRNAAVRLNSGIAAPGFHNAPPAPRFRRRRNSMPFLTR
jgi:hypothetical protein